MAYISGIQQVGIGCTDASTTFTWIRKTFGLNVKIFDDEAKAALMTLYTGGEVHARRAILAMNHHLQIDVFGFFMLQYRTYVLLFTFRLLRALERERKQPTSEDRGLYP